MRLLKGQCHLGSSDELDPLVLSKMLHYRADSRSPLSRLFVFVYLKGFIRGDKALRLWVKLKRIHTVLSVNDLITPLLRVSTNPTTSSKKCSWSLLAGNWSFSSTHLLLDVNHMSAGLTGQSRRSLQTGNTWRTQSTAAWRFNKLYCCCWYSSEEAANRGTVKRSSAASTRTNDLSCRVLQITFISENVRFSTTTYMIFLVRINNKSCLSSEIQHNQESRFGLIFKLKLGTLRTQTSFCFHQWSNLLICIIIISI